jgi:bifunctional isochorismate lyase/aryl carrier protein
MSDHLSRKNIHKDEYFNAGNFDSLTESWLHELEHYQKSQTFHPSNSALLILDMQKVFIDPSSHAFIPSAPIIIPGIQSLASLFIERGLPVIRIRHINTKENAGSMSQWWNRLIFQEDEDSQIIPELSHLETPLFVKSQYDAFYRTPLEESLKEKGVTQIIVTGVMTHLCCETTARSAFMRGFSVFFPVDGTATYNANFHRASILNLSHGFANITSIPELSRILEPGKSHGE